MLIAVVLSPIGFGMKYYVDEKERISNMSKEEYTAYTESIEQEKQIRLKEEEESRRRNAQEDEEFKNKMQTYETDSIHLTESNRGNYAVFVLENVSSSDDVYVFGVDLPVGRNANLHMNGRGEVGYEMKGLTKSWSRAGNYGIYHYESRDLPRISDGDKIIFSNLSSVEVTIFF